MTAGKLAFAGLVLLCLAGPAGAYTNGDTTRSLRPPFCPERVLLLEGGWLDADAGLLRAPPPLAAPDQVMGRFIGGGEGHGGGHPPGGFAGFGGAGGGYSIAGLSGPDPLLPPGLLPPGPVPPHGHPPIPHGPTSGPTDGPQDGPTAGPVTPTEQIPPVPLPPGLVMALSGLGALFGAGRLRRRRA
ncbi:hypothetical protein V8J36_17505 [Frigidibacter sp. MR17.14]|uniref:hypothetical protein n=1 Tax=Frigidibacter sp. MR17.14 TaxID=3126509 RepID=UPI003012D158